MHYDLVMEIFSCLGKFYSRDVYGVGRKSWTPDSVSVLTRSIIYGGRFTSWTLRVWKSNTLGLSPYSYVWVCTLPLSSCRGDPRVIGAYTLTVDNEHEPRLRDSYTIDTIPIIRDEIVNQTVFPNNNPS